MGIGVTVVFSEANGTFEAYADTSGGSISAAVIHISNTYKADSDASAMQPNKGSFNLNYLSVNGNFATAIVGAAANTGIQGGGTVNVGSGSVTITATGTATADAVIEVPTFSVSAITIGADSAVALQSAIQNTYIKGAFVTAGSVAITSDLNKKDGTTLPTSAYATIGQGSNAVGGITVSLSLYSAKVNVTVATADATNNAFTSGAGFDVAGAITISGNSTSYALANLTESVSVSLASIGVNTLYAYAEGTFGAYMELGSQNVSAGSISITNDYEAKADATVRQPAGGTGLDFSGVDIEGNIALAEITTNANTGIRGNSQGTVSTDGDITITATGVSTALAKVEEPLLSVSGLKIAANVVKATQSAVQDTFIGNVVISGRGT